MYIVKHLQRACAQCGDSFDHLNASQMNSVHFDHQDPRTKAPGRKQPNAFANDWPEEAFVEWTKCESTCVECHDHVK
jgi:hypothetical protein